MAAIVSWQPNEACDQVIRHLVQGDCVVLPTESTYEIVASALHPDAVANLCRVGGSPAIVLSDYPTLFDWLPLLKGAGARLIRKLGAGPVVLSADANYRAGLWAQLPARVRELLAPADRLSVRWPAHAITDELCRTNLPLVSAPLESALTAAAAASLVGETTACIVDAGPAHIGMPPSRVEADGRRLRLTRPGGLSREHFDALVICRIVFVCTGNTCRSPMAQALCKKQLADRLGCSVAELHQHGFLVQSAGLAATMGADASPESVVVATEHGADLAHHKSSMMTMELLQWADHVFAMTSGHWYTLLSATPAGLVEPRMLSPEYIDVSDPIGGELADYRTCAQQILECLEQRVPELLES